MDLLTLLGFVGCLFTPWRLDHPRSRRRSATGVWLDARTSRQRPQTCLPRARITRAACRAHARSETGVMSRFPISGEPVCQMDLHFKCRLANVLFRQRWVAMHALMLREFGKAEILGGVMSYVIVRNQSGIRHEKCRCYWRELSTSLNRHITSSKRARIS